MGIFFVASCSSWREFSGKFQNLLLYCISNGAPPFSATYFDVHTMQMRKCLYADVYVFIYFVYKCIYTFYVHSALICTPAMSVLYTHAHDMRVYI
jgi:hypothetical protein